MIEVEKEEKVKHIVTIDIINLLDYLRYKGINIIDDYQKINSIVITPDKLKIEFEELNFQGIESYVIE